MNPQFHICSKVYKTCLEKKTDDDISELKWAKADPNSTLQKWTWLPNTGQLEGATGGCLDANPRDQNWGNVITWTCNPENKNQIWERNSIDGQLKLQFGFCLET